MRARRYPERFHVEQSDDFLQRHNAFLLLHTAWFRWGEIRLFNKKGWHVTELGPNGYNTLWLVEKAD